MAVHKKKSKHPYFRVISKTKFPNTKKKISKNVQLILEKIPHNNKNIKHKKINFKFEIFIRIIW